MIPARHLSFSILIGCAALLAVPDRARRAAALPEPKPSKIFYVSQDGRDSWTGDLPSPRSDLKDGPFRTLERAQTAVRQWKRSKGLPPGGLGVELLPGLYELSATLQFSGEDSGAPGTPVVWRGNPKEKPVLVGGKRIRGFKPFRDKILKADLSADFPRPEFRQLFFNGKRQILARYPNFDEKNPYGGGWAYVAGSMSDREKPDSKRSFKFREEDKRAWAKPEEGEIFIYPGPNYRNNILPIESVDIAKNLYNLSRDADYAFRPVDRYYVRNLMEELDAPGEWYLDAAAKALYFWPPTDIESGVVLAPVLDRLLVAEGARDIQFRGFTLECAEDAAFLLTNCVDCLVAGHVIRNVVGKPTGMGAVVVVGGSNVGVVGNDLSDIGTTAIHLAGGERRDLIPASHFAENNYIHHVGVVYARGVGLNIDGVGQRASHNLIHDCPRFALIFYGNDHRIEYNRLRHMNLQTEDSGATYCWGRDFLTARGCRIAYNHISDSLGYGKKLDTWVSPYYAWGIYLDDDCCGVDVVGNIVVNANRAGIHFHNARDIVASNNLFINNGLHDLEMSGWTESHRFFRNFVTNMDATWRAFAHLPAWQKYRGLAKAPPSEAGFMVDNLIVKNIFYSTNEKANVYSVRNFSWDRTTIDSNVVWHPNGIPTVQGVKTEPAEQWAEWQRLGLDRHSVVADPLFTDVARGDFRLKPGSPALALGFQNIPQDLIGPYADALRATWPIREAEGVREHPISGIDAPVPVKAAKEAARVDVPKAPPVRVDGLIPAGEYPRRFPLKDTPRHEPPAGGPCEAAISHDGVNLNLAVKVPVRDMERLKKGETWGEDDGVEICLAVITEGTPISEVFVLHGFYGGKADVSVEGASNPRAAKALGAALKFAPRPYNNIWVGEFSLPLSALGVNYRSGLRLAFNAGVRRSENREWIVWVGTGGPTHAVDRAGVIVLE
ncbi:MAG: right-handed parallel beta-helix repeat-containing protein [Spirochaetes bacterium]|nr:right-handed parallel beta-helix repeat-containing protein [Spirochaetota bacterium]